jgi:hypothetical protein
MGKFLVWALIVGLLAVVGFLLYDGGYIGKWTGGSEAAVTRPTQGIPSAPLDKIEQPSLADQPPQKGNSKPDVHSQEPEAWLGRLTVGNGLAIFAVAIVLCAIIKLLSKLIPTVIVHRKG